MKKLLFGLVLVGLLVFPLQFVNSLPVARTALVASVSLPPNTVVNVLAQTVVMPSVDCPCRIAAFWHLWTSVNANSTFEAFVDDGQVGSKYGESTVLNVPGGFSGFSGSGLSRNVYVNNQTVTITLKAQNFGAFTETIPAGGIGTNAESYLQTAVVLDPQILQDERE